jgi:DUF971 family protein
MTSAGPARPTRIAPFPNGEIGVVWQDGHESYFGGHALRCACACATCVDEMSGEKLLRDDRVPGDVQALEILPVGNYGVSIRWSDGHDTGIYTFERLRALCPCDRCRGV